jgi:hypothetical protein
MIRNLGGTSTAVAVAEEFVVGDDCFFDFGAGFEALGA